MRLLRTKTVPDLIFLAATVVLFWASALYTRRCDRI
jgi:hypothetical protein